MRKSVVVTLFFALISITMNVKAQRIVKLWESNPPTENGLVDSEKFEDKGDWSWITNISSPELHIYQADKSNNSGVGVVICPGGGYAGLAFSHEGVQFAQWLNEQGVTAIILKYRMPNGHKEIPLDDAQQAIRYIREHAKELGISINKIGIAGFSAGGHLASTTSTHYATNGTSTRPDFSILFYPVISMEEITHQGSKRGLLGENISSLDVYKYSNEKQVNSSTPPAILLLSDDDKSVDPQNSVGYYTALKNNGVPAAMYIFPEGGHGWGMKKDFKYHTEMLSLLKSWLDDVKKEKIK